MERTAVFPGSFDPFTRGHEALVSEALALFDRVVIAIGHNTAKAGLLRVDDRRRLIEAVYAGEPRVAVRTYTGLATPPISSTSARWRPRTAGCSAS